MSNHGTAYAERRIELEPLLSISDTSRVLGVSRRQVYRLIEARAIKPLRVGERFRLEPSEVRRYLAQQRAAP